MGKTMKYITKKSLNELIRNKRQAELPDFLKIAKKIVKTGKRISWCGLYRYVDVQIYNNLNECNNLYNEYDKSKITKQLRREYETICSIMGETPRRVKIVVRGEAVCLKWVK